MVRQRKVLKGVLHVMSYVVQDCKRLAHLVFKIQETLRRVNETDIVVKNKVARDSVIDRKSLRIDARTDRKPSSTSSPALRQHLQRHFVTLKGVDAFEDKASSTH